MVRCLSIKNFLIIFFNQQKLYLMKKNFFRSSVAKMLGQSFVIAFFLLFANISFAQTTEQATKNIQAEVAIMKQDFAQQQSISLNGATAQAEIAAAVKYRFYKTAGDYIQKYGITAGVDKTYNLFTENGTRPSAHVDAAKTALLAMLASL